MRIFERRVGDAVVLDLHGPLASETLGLHRDCSLIPRAVVIADERSTARQSN